MRVCIPQVHHVRVLGARCHFLDRRAACLHRLSVSSRDFRVVHQVVSGYGLADCVFFSDRQSITCPAAVCQIAPVQRLRIDSGTTDVLTANGYAEVGIQNCLLHVRRCYTVPGLGNGQRRNFPYVCISKFNTTKIRIFVDNNCSGRIISACKRC